MIQENKYYVNVSYLSKDTKDFRLYKVDLVFGDGAVQLTRVYSLKRLNPRPIGRVSKDFLEYHYRPATESEVLLYGD